MKIEKGPHQACTEAEKFDPIPKPVSPLKAGGKTPPLGLCAQGLMIFGVVWAPPQKANVSIPLLKAITSVLLQKT